MLDGWNRDRRRPNHQLLGARARLAAASLWGVDGWVGGWVSRGGCGVEEYHARRRPSCSSLGEGTRGKGECPWPAPPRHHPPAHAAHAKAHVHGGAVGCLWGVRLCGQRRPEKAKGSASIKSLARASCSSLLAALPAPQTQPPTRRPPWPRKQQGRNYLPNHPCLTMYPSPNHRDPQVAWETRRLTPFHTTYKARNKA